jgi:tetratricopeptide (TPR) repeat protein
MTAAQTVTGVQQRLAQHYLDTLRRANLAIYRGRGNRAYWYNRIDQDWLQIQRWQTWSALAADANSVHARICLDFSIAGLEVLRVRQTPQERIAWLKQALQAAQRINDNAAERTILHELGHTYFVVGASDEARQTAQHLLQIAEASGDDFNTGRAWYVLGQAGLHVGALDDADNAFQKSVAFLERVGAEAELGRALQGMGRVAMYRGNIQSARDFFTRYLRIVEGSGREAELAPAYLTMNHILLELRDYPSAKTYAERALQICLNTGFQRMLPPVWLALGVTESEIGDLEVACRHYEAGMAAARVMQARASLIELQWYLGDARMRQSRYGEAYTYLQEALRLADEDRILYFLCEIMTALTRWHLEQNQIEAARNQLREAISYALELGSDNFLALALVPSIMLWRQVNRAEQAAQWAGLLALHAEYMHPRLFDPLCAQLEQQLGTDRYRQSLEQGKLLTLKGAVTDVMGSLDVLETEIQ